MVKKIIFIITAIFLVNSIASADMVYVSSLRTKIYAKADRSSTVIASFNKGTMLSIVSEKGSWLNIRSAGKQGWVQKFFTSKQKPGKKFSILGSAKSNSKVHTRKRASSDVTAASARGLMDENSAVMGRTRAVDRNTGFDPEALDRMERIYVSEDDLLLFLRKGGIQ